MAYKGDNMGKNKKSESKKKIKSLMFTIVLAAVVILIFAYLIWNNGNLLPKSQQKAETVIALVNGEKITQEELDKRYSSLSAIEQSVITKDDMLQRLIDGKLLLQEAGNQGITVSDAELNEQMLVIRQQFPSEDALNEFLKERNFTKEEMEKQVKNQLLINKLIQQALSDINVSDKEILDFYNENKDQFYVKENQTRAAHILICYREAVGCTANYTKDEAYALISKIKEETKRKDFSELARQYSTDNSASRGGQLGIIIKGTMVPEFEEAAFSLKVGQISDIVETQFGYHLIKRLPDKVSLDEAKEVIKSYLIRAKQTEALELYLQQLRDSADIKSMNETIATESKTEEPIKNEFTSTGKDICLENGKPIIRFYTSSQCARCKEIQKALEAAVKDFDITLYEWELDTGDNLFTEEVETSLPQKEFEAVSNYNAKYAVPAFVFGCVYVRVGNTYTQLNLLAEEEIFREVLTKLTK